MKEILKCPVCGSPKIAKVNKFRTTMIVFLCGSKRELSPRRGLDLFEGGSCQNYLARDAEEQSENSHDQISVNNAEKQSA